MKDMDLHKYIEEQGQKEKEELFQRVIEPLTFKDKKPNEDKKPRKYLSYLIPTIACICLLIIIVPIMFVSASNREKYYTANDCEYQRLDYTAKEYSERNKLNLLYIDWYDYSVETYTYLFTDKKDKDKFVYLKESLVNTEKKVASKLYILERKVKVAELDEYDEMCKSSTYLNNIKIYYYNKFPSKSFAHFEYNKFHYYIELNSLQENFSDEQYIINFIKDLLE